MPGGEAWAVAVTTHGAPRCAGAQRGAAQRRAALVACDVTWHLHNSSSAKASENNVSPPGLFVLFSSV